jgi:GT2 family glycosyltransferase
VTERVQGLTPARHRGVRSTAAPWLAFVDDDCLLAPSWVGAAIRFAREHPEAAGFGGRVVPTYLGETPSGLAEYGWLFAEQGGDEPHTVDGLVGAGMVINRDALVASGWVDRPLLTDRIGHRLVSGGDIEIALRLIGTGRALWYTPTMHLDHLIAAHRTRPGYLLRLDHGIGVAHMLADAVVWRGSRRRWLLSAASRLARTPRALLDAAWRTHWNGWSIDPLLAAAYELGLWQGVLRVAVRHRALIGAGQPAGSAAEIGLASASSTRA